MRQFDLPHSTEELGVQTKQEPLTPGRFRKILLYAKEIG
jgi:hypothetical protein